MICSPTWGQVLVSEKRDAVRVEVKGSVLLVDGSPLFPTIIQHNGESFGFLQSLGFNTIQLAAPATQEQLNEASGLGLWIVCPPPSSARISAITSQYDSVLAWSVGENTDGDDLQIIRQTTDEIRDSDSRGKRPVIAHAGSHWRTIGQAVDILGVGKKPIASNFPLNEYSAWLQRVSQNANKPLWADIQTESSIALNRQVESMIGSQPPLPVEHQQLLYLLYESITGGSRGIRFLSQNRLDNSVPATQLRANTLAWLLRHVRQISPWAAGGLVQKIDNIASDDDLEIHSVKLVGSNLLLIQRPTGFEQLVCGDQPVKSIDFLDASTSGSDRVYLVDELGAQLLENQRSNISSRINVPSCHYAAAVLITQDPIMVQSINQQNSTIKNDGAALNRRVNLVRQWLAYTQLFEQQLASTGLGFPFVGGARQQAENNLRNATQIIERGDTQTGLNYLNQADFHLATIRRKLIEQNLSEAAGMVSSPLLMHFGLVPYHLQLSSKLAGATWNPNSLTGGDFENLEQMTTAGWVNHRDETDAVSTKVELERQAAVDGFYGLQMKVSAGRNSIQSTPLWIKSANVAVQEGQLIRIHGFVNVIGQASDEPDVFSITDSLSGPDMTTRFGHTNGWQEFTIYRAVRKSDNLAVTFSMSAEGTAMIDEVTIRTMDQPNLQIEANEVNSAGPVRTNIK